MARASILSLIALAGCPLAAPDAPSDIADADAGAAAVVDGGRPGEDGRDAGGPDAGASEGGPVDAGLADAGLVDAGPVDAGRGHEDGGLGPLPTDALLPVPGELTLLQLDLPAVGIGLNPLGESGILVGPDGTLLLLDVGNAIHDDDVAARIEQLNTTVLTPERGFAARDPMQVEYVVLTHYHSDHIGAFEQLMLTGDAPLTGVLAVVHRGFGDVGPSVSESDFEEACSALRGPLAAIDVPLCDVDIAPPCDAAAWAGTYPITGCPGLPMDLDLGGGASITLVGAAGHVTDGATVEALEFGVDESNEENARSLVGIVTFGAFRHHIGGDLTGAGEPGIPDVESHLVAVAGPAFYGDLGVDVAHAHHHARDTSSNLALVHLLAPNDGRSRNVIAGVNLGYLGSPEADVLGNWGDDARLGDGRFWIPRTTLGGAGHEVLEVAEGEVVVQTALGGDAYWVQAVPADGAAPWAMGFSSVAAAP